MNVPAKPKAEVQHFYCRPTDLARWLLFKLSRDRIVWPLGSVRCILVSVVNIRYIRVHTNGITIIALSAVIAVCCNVTGVLDDTEVFLFSFASSILIFRVLWMTFAFFKENHAHRFKFTKMRAVPVGFALILVFFRKVSPYYLVKCCFCIIVSELEQPKGELSFVVLISLRRYSNFRCHQCKGVNSCLKHNHDRHLLCYKLLH